MAGKVGRSVGWVCLLIAVSTLCTAEDRMGVCYGEKTGVVVYDGGWGTNHANSAEREIRLRNLAGTETSVVCRPDDQFLNLQLSPSEDKLGFMQMRDPNKPIWDLRLIRLTGKDIACIPNIDEYSWSPDGGLLACHLSLGRSFRELRLLTPVGEEVGRIPDVKRHVWSPDGRFVACLAGPYNLEENSCGGGPPLPLLLYEVASQKTTSILWKGKPLEAWQPYWAGFDGRLYVTTYVFSKHTVFAYDPVSQSLESTSHMNLSFSPNGTYYYDYGISEDEVYMRLYVTRNDEDITDQWPFQEWIARRMGEPFWLDDHTLSFSKGDGGDLLLDLDAKTARYTSGFVVTYVNDKQDLLVRTQQDIIKEKVSALEVVWPEKTSSALPAEVPGTP